MVIAAIGVGVGLAMTFTWGLVLHQCGAAAFRAEAALGAAPGPVVDADAPAVLAWDGAVHVLMPPEDSPPLAAVFVAPTRAEAEAFNLWLEVGTGTPRPIVTEYWTTHRDRVLALVALLKRGDLSLAVLPHAGEGGLPAALVQVLNVALVLQVGARIEADPLPFIDAYDHLLAALDGPRTRLQGLYAIEISRLRDQVYLTAALRGKLPADRAGVWTAEPSTACALLAEGLAGERALVAIPALAQQVDRNPFSAMWGDANDDGSVWSRWRIWCAFPDAAAEVIAAQRDCINGLNGDPAWTWETRDVDGRATVRTGLFDLSNTAVTADMFHRLARLAAAVGDWQRREHELPADGTDLALISPVVGVAKPGEIALVYQRLGPDRFRIVVDPGQAQSLPRYVNAQRYLTDWTKEFQGLSHLSVELELPVRNAGVQAE